MMKEFDYNMGCDKEQYDHINDMVENINKHLGKEVFTIVSTPEYENELVDIFEGDEPNSTYISFDEAETYLQGVERGVLLKEEYAV